MLVAAVAKPTNEVRTTVTIFEAEPRNTTQSVGVAYGAVAVMRTVYVAFVLPFISAMSATESSPAASVRILPPRKAFRGVTPGTLALPAGVPFTSHWEAPVKFAMIYSFHAPLIDARRRCQEPKLAFSEAVTLYTSLDTAPPPGPRIVRILISTPVMSSCTLV